MLSHVVANKPLHEHLFRRLSAEWWLAGILLSLFVWGLMLAGVGDRYNRIIYDFLTRVSPVEARHDVALVLVDDASLEGYGSWPWDRSLQADLINAIADGRPRSILVNIHFPEGGELFHDQILAAAIGRAGVPIGLSLAVEAGAQNAERNVVLPAERLVSAATAVGHSSFAVDEDGLVRRWIPRLDTAQRSWPALPALSVRSSTHGPSDSAADVKGALIPFATIGDFEVISAAELLSGLGRERIRGRHIILGVSATGVETKFSTPLSGRAGLLSGSEVQAHVLSALLDGRERQTLSGIAAWILAVLPLWILLLSLRRARPGRTLLLPAVVLLGYFLFAWGSFTIFGLFIPQSTGIMGLFLLYPLWAWRRLIAIMAFLSGELSHFANEFPDLSDLKAQSGMEPLLEMASKLAVALEESRTLRHFVTETITHLPTATLVLNVSGNVRMVNSAAQNLFASCGRSAEVETWIGELMEVFRSSEASLDMAQWLSREAGAVRRSVEITSADGREFEFVVGPLDGGDRRTYAWIVQIVDITSVKAALRQREELLQLLTHDLRSPLASAITLVDRAHDNANSETLSHIGRLVRRALARADDFVLHARARALRYHLELASLHLLLSDAVEEMRPLADRAGVYLELLEVKGKDDVLCDHDLVLRCFTNLIGNALKHAVGSARIECSIVFVEDAREVVATVRDWGPGVAELETNAIFEKYYQAGPGRAVGGAGLGLAFTITVANGHGGRVEVENCTPGCAFRLILPAYECLNAQDADWVY